MCFNAKVSFFIFIIFVLFTLTFKLFLLSNIYVHYLNMHRHIYILFISKFYIKICKYRLQCKYMIRMYVFFIIIYKIFTLYRVIYPKPVKELMCWALSDVCCCVGSSKEQKFTSSSYTFPVLLPAPYPHFVHLKNCHI